MPTDPQPLTEWEQACLKYRGEILTGYAGHCCPEWDELPIDETCIEYPCCGVLPWLTWWQRPIVRLRSWRTHRTFDHEARLLEGSAVERRFVCSFTRLGWWHWSCGVHLDVRHPHIQIHVPFGYVRFGWCACPLINQPRRFGYDGWDHDEERMRALHMREKADD